MGNPRSSGKEGVSLKLHRPGDGSLHGPQAAPRFPCVCAVSFQGEPSKPLEGGFCASLCRSVTLHGCLFLWLPLWHVAFPCQRWNLRLNVSGKAWGTGSSRLGNDRGGKHSTPGTDHKPVSGRGQTGVPAGNGGSTRQGRPASRLPPSSCPFQNLGSRSPDFSREEGNLHFQGKSPDG